MGEVMFGTQEAFAVCDNVEAYIWYCRDNIKGITRETLFDYAQYHRRRGEYRLARYAHALLRQYYHRMYTEFYPRWYE